MFTSDSCVRIRPGELQSDHSQGLAILEAVQEFTAVESPWIHIDVARGAGGLAPGWLRRAATQTAWCAIRGHLDDLFPVAAARGVPPLVVVTLLMDDAVHPDRLAALRGALDSNQWVLQCEWACEAERREEAIRQVDPWLDFVTGTEEDVFGSAKVAIGSDGHIESRDGLVRSALPVWVSGIRKTLSEMGLEPGESLRLRGYAVVPNVVRVPEPEGPGRVVYHPAGTQSFCCWLLREEARAAFGFRSDERDEFAGWLERIARVNADCGIVSPTFASIHYGRVEGTEGLLVPPRRDRHAISLEFAGLIATGDFARLEAMAGLWGCRAAPAERTRPAVVDDARFGVLVKRVAADLANAIAILVMSRLPGDKRHEAAKALLAIGSRDSRRAAALIAKVVPEIGFRILRRFRQRGPRKRIEEGKDPVKLRAHVADAIQALRMAFSDPREVRHDV